MKKSKVRKISINKFLRKGFPITDWLAFLRDDSRRFLFFSSEFKKTKKALAPNGLPIALLLLLICFAVPVFEK